MELTLVTMVPLLILVITTMRRQLSGEIRSMYNLKITNIDQDRHIHTCHWVVVTAPRPLLRNILLSDQWRRYLRYLVSTLKRLYTGMAITQKTITLYENDI